MILSRNGSIFTDRESTPSVLIYAILQAEHWHPSRRMVARRLAFDKLLFDGSNLARRLATI
jgi:hypothetical protein